MLPVVIGIHGGGFEIGSAAWIPGEELIKVTRDVIFISIQYRLGIWGLQVDPALQLRCYIKVTKA